MDDHAAEFVKISDESTYERDGSLTKNRVYVFYLGKRGPFTVKVPLANFDPLEIDRRVQELRSHLVNLPK